MIGSPENSSAYNKLCTGATVLHESCNQTCQTAAGTSHFTLVIFITQQLTLFLSRGQFN